MHGGFRVHNPTIIKGCNVHLYSVNDLRELGDIFWQELLGLHSETVLSNNIVAFLIKVFDFSGQPKGLVVTHCINYCKDFFLRSFQCLHLF